MKSVKIVTYCTCSSIGSVLQSFALKKALLSKGYDSQIFLERKKQRKMPRTGKISISYLMIFL